MTSATVVTVFMFKEFLFVNLSDQYGLSDPFKCALESVYDGFQY